MAKRAPIDIACNAIITKANETAMDELSHRHWALFFKDMDTGNFIIYDAKETTSTIRAIKISHPNYKFIGLRGCDSQKSAVEYAMAMRLANKLLPIARQYEEAMNAEIAKQTNLAETEIV